MRVKNWGEFQQYKDRDPKWIKLHRDLLDDYDLEQIDEIQQLYLIKIWLLAAKLDNKVPNDADWVKRKIGARSKVDLKQLCTSGFLVAYSDVQERTETYLETETEEETEEEKEGRRCPHFEIIDAYHEILHDRPAVVKSLWHKNPSAKNLKARWDDDPEHQDVDWWRGFFEAVRTNDWWMGRNEKWQKGVTLHWLLEQKNFIKVVEHWANLGKAA